MEAQKAENLIRELGIQVRYLILTFFFVVIKSIELFLFVFIRTFFFHSLFSHFHAWYCRVLSLHNTLLVVYFVVVR